jgi:hypothetical protein
MSVVTSLLLPLLPAPRNLAQGAVAREKKKEPRSRHFKFMMAVLKYYNNENNNYFKNDYGNNNFLLSPVYQYKINKYKRCGGQRTTRHRRNALPLRVPA